MDTQRRPSPRAQRRADDRLPAADLVLLADGGALSDLNARIKAEAMQTERFHVDATAGRPTSVGNRQREVGVTTIVDAPRFERPINFLHIPEQVISALSDQCVVECPIEKRIFFNVGTEKAKNFIESMNSAWTVDTYALSTVRYDRNPKPGEVDPYPFRLRFHAGIAFAIGLLVGSRSRETGPSELARQKIIVGVVTDDPHMLPCMGSPQLATTGIEAKLVWWESYLDEQVSNLARRNNVNLLLLPQDHYREERSSFSALSGLLSTTR